MPRVKAGTRTKRVRRRQRGADLARGCRHDPSVRIDGCRHPRIRRRQQPPVILDRPHLRLLQVLLPGAAVAVPAVIRDIHQNLCALQRSLPHFVGKDRFIADKHSRAARPRRPVAFATHLAETLPLLWSALQQTQTPAETASIHRRARDALCRSAQPTRPAG